MTGTSRPRALAPTVLAVTLAVTVVGALAGCGTSEEPEAAPSPTSVATSPTTTAPSTPAPTAAAEPEGTVVTLDVDNPVAGMRVKVGVGEKIVLRLTASAGGELHVHSSPEQEIEFPAGTTDVPLVIDRPGIVDVEDHETDALLVQLEVS